VSNFTFTLFVLMFTMSHQSPSVTLSDADREELGLMLASRTLASADVFRANLILMLADGKSYAEIQARLGTTAPTISRWKKRFAEHGIAGLMQPVTSGRKPTVITSELKERVIAATCRRPSDGSARWSCRSLAKELGLSKDVIQRIWRSEGLRPNRLERFMTSEDAPDARQAVELVGLYMRPLQNAAVFCQRGKSTVRAAGSAVSGARGTRESDSPHTSQGQLSLYMALSGAPGHAKSGRSARHPKDDCVAFLGRLLSHRADLQFTVILDRLGRDEAPRIELFLKEHPNISLQLAPSRAIWFERLEQWCSTGEPLSDDAAKRNSAHAVTRQIIWHVRAYSKSGRAIQWVSSEFSDQY
jgi:transposase